MNPIYRTLSISLFVIFTTTLIVPSASAQKYSEPQRPMKYWTAEEFAEWERHQIRNQSLKKSTAGTERNFGMHNGNKLRTLFYNYGSIGRPNTEPSIEWPIFSGNGYAYEFGAIVGAEVVDHRDQTIQFFSDGMADGGDRNQKGGPNVWGWEPLPGWGVAPAEYKSWSTVEQDKGGIAVSSRPRTWGSEFPPNETFSGSSINGKSNSFAASTWLIN